jgi:hypothetical protein
MVTAEILDKTVTGKDVEQKVTDCLQDWAHAGSDAVAEMVQKQKIDEAAVSKNDSLFALLGI